MRLTVQYTLVVAVLVTTPYLYARSLVDQTPEKWGAATNGLQMAICPVQATWSSTEDPEFEIAFRNVGSRDFVLNLGVTLGNGLQYFATAIHLILIDAQGFRKECDVQGPISVWGRIDDYVIVLQSGAVHILRLKLSQCHSPQAKDLGIKLRQEPDSLHGHYQISAVFDGFDTQHANSGTSWTGWSFWIGTLPSNYAVLTITH